MMKYTYCDEKGPRTLQTATDLTSGCNFVNISAREGNLWTSPEYWS